jgi:RecB family exonuclease
MARVAAARTGTCGTQILTMDQLAARLAGGFLRPIDPEALHEAVRAALAETELGELEPIKFLPGMVRAAIDTFGKVWRAGIDLYSRPEEPRLKALAALERAVLLRLPPSMRPPAQLVEGALERLRHAPAVLGPVEVHGHSEMPPCWRRLLLALAGIVPVTWVAGPRPVPKWLRDTKVQVQTAQSETPDIALFSCASPQHEAVEALRWARGLMAAGTARPEEIAIAAASPAELDDHMLALRREANLPMHFVHGVKAVSERDGQAAAALAEILVKGLSQERVRRLFRLLHDRSPALAGLPPAWTRVLPADATLTTLARWEQVFQNNRAAWPQGVEHSAAILEILALVARGPAAASEAGDKLLTGLAHRLWCRALVEGPAEALPVTLSELRTDDRSEAAASIVWCSAAALASVSRPFVRLIGLNAGRWPRRISEDRLIPDHIVPLEELDPLPVAEADRRDLATIEATTARSVTVSYSRRDAEGRLLGQSPLISGMAETYLARGHAPEHAASEADRLLDRPAEFASIPIGRSGLACWRGWYGADLTAYDGLLAANHPRIRKVLSGAQSASSLRLLLRDPLGFVWKYALGWRQPEEAEEPTTLDALSIGNLVHEVLRETVDELERGSGLANAAVPRIEAAIAAAEGEVARRWETEEAVPPRITWDNARRRARDLASRALAYPLERLADQTSWTEVPFGISAGAAAEYHDLPWNAAQPIEIPGTGVTITGYIDRLDIAGDHRTVRVIDYKTGRLSNKPEEIRLNGGRELQRCLYAFAVKTLLGQSARVQAALLYPGVAGEAGLYPLTELDQALDVLAGAISTARSGLEAGVALPGKDAGGIYNDLAFALPANAASGYLARKELLITGRLGDATKIWEEA